MGKFPDDDGLPRPHKRPSQARSQFTVQALYDAFVRIWRRDGASAASMRAIAEEAGYAVGTLYEYFPNREAVLSGYFRYCLEDLCRRLREADDDDAQPWQERLRRLVAASLDADRRAPYFDADMLLLESEIADAAQHQKAFVRLCDAFGAQLASWADLPELEHGAIEALVTHLWGARRYAILLGRRDSSARDVERAAVMLEAFLLDARRG